jgi:hypothetical protein
MAASPHKDAFLVPAYSDFVVWEAGIFLSGAEKYVREIYSQIKRQRQDANRKKQLGWGYCEQGLIITGRRLI